MYTHFVPPDPTHYKFTPQVLTFLLFVTFLIIIVIFDCVKSTVKRVMKNKSILGVSYTDFHNTEKV